MILQMLKVEGSSLHPDYQDGDYVLVSRLPWLFSRVHPGDVVVFDHPRLGKMIKFVQRLEQDGRAVYVIGRDADSVDSRIFGAVPRNLLLGKVIWHIPGK